ncbi:MAG: HlyC/CorC family transporter [Chloroflexi bacterium]|nr:HlyC/CorC family transporter [Chloroflexota bacterium]MYE40205.1 HlyC/CorC family transporter [Chloroflexota bacterium]
MDAGDSWRWGLLALCLILSAFFSASETAFSALPKARLLHLQRTGRTGAGRVSGLIQRPERFLATVLLSNNLVNTAAAALFTVIVVDLIGNPSISVLVSTIGVTLVLLIFCETLPKTIAWHRSEMVAFAVSRPLYVVGLALAPAVTVLQGITTVAKRAIGITDSSQHVGEEEIRTLIAAGAQTGTVEADEAELLEKVFRFGDRQMREVITPRPEIVWLEKGATLSEFLEIYQISSHTRFPVFEGSKENVIGILSVKDVLSGLSAGQISSESDVTTLLREAYIVPETKSVSDTFAEMRQARHTVALTFDEFGGIAGLATTKQLLEVIVGQVGDEGPAPEETVTHLGGDSYLVDAAVGISEINEELGLDIPEGDYQTLAGFILAQLGRIPENDDVVEYRDLSITVKAMDGVRIDEVELMRVPAATVAEDVQ